MYKYCLQIIIQGVHKNDSISVILNHNYLTIRK